MSDPLNHSRQICAEEVRQHLVLLRGGAPFLSPADACLLDQWLSEGVGVPAILHALERASEHRRSRRTRVPLSLKHARKHLKKSLAIVDEKSEQIGRESAAEHPLAKLALNLAECECPEEQSGDLLVLSEGLVALPADDWDRLVRGALELFRRFLSEVWNGMTDLVREEELERARAELIGLAGVMTDSALAKVVEEVARDRIRRQYPLLTAEALWDTLRQCRHAP